MTCVILASTTMELDFRFMGINSRLALQPLEKKQKHVTGPDMAFLKSC